MQKTQHSVHSLVSDAQVQKIKQWLSPSDTSTNYNDARDKRHPGTGAWLIEGAAFREWKSHPRGRLLLLGLSGCGKTVLTSTVLEHLYHLCSEQDPSCTILYFFFDFRDKSHKQTLDQLLRSLAFQLYTQCDHSRAVVDATFNSFERGHKQPSTDDLSKAVIKIMQTAQSHIFVVLDALDECHTRKELITWLDDCSSQDLTSMSFIATSRPEVEFESSLTGWRKENISSNAAKSINDDIKSFIEAKLCGEQFQRWASTPEMRQKIEAEVLKKASTM